MPASLPSIIKCDSKLILEHELDLIRPQLCLTETEETWDTILKALSRLTALCKGGACDYPFELIAFLRDCVRSIVGALYSERSRLSGCAADMIGIVASGFGHSFEPLLLLLFPPLLTLCTRPNKLFISRARSCILLIIEHTQLPAILSYLVTALKEKSVSLRLTAIECVLACLNSFNPRDLEKETRAKEVEAAIKATATDSSAEVRKVSRRVFDTYKMLFQHRVESFVSPLTPTTKKYLDIKAIPSCNIQSRPPSRPESAQSSHSRGTDERVAKAALIREKKEKTPPVHCRSTSAPQVVSGKGVGIALPTATTSSRHNKRSHQPPNLASGERRGAERGRPEMAPPDRVPARQAQRPTSSMSSRSQDGAVQCTVGSSRDPGKAVESESAATIGPAAGLVRRINQPGNNAGSASSAPLRPPMHRRTATTEGCQEGPSRPTRARNVAYAKPEAKDMASSTKGPKRVPVALLESAKTSAGESKTSAKPLQKDDTHVTSQTAGAWEKDSAKDLSSKTSVPKTAALKSKKSSAALTTQAATLQTRRSVLAKSETGTTATGDARLRSKEEGWGKGTRRAATAKSVQETKRKEISNGTAKAPSTSATTAPGKTSSAENRARKDHTEPSSISSDTNQVLEPEKIALPPSPGPATPTVNLAPLPTSPEGAWPVLSSQDVVVPSVEQQDENVEPSRETTDNQKESDQHHANAGPLPPTQLVEVKEPRRPLHPRVAFMQGEPATPAKTPISKLVSAIERGFIFTPGSPGSPGSAHSDSELYDSSFDVLVHNMTQVPALALPSKDVIATGDQSF